MARRIAALALLFFLVGCKDEDLAKVAKGLQITSEVIGQLQTAVIEANTQGLMSDDDVRIVLTACAKVNQAGWSATQLTKEIAKLTDPTRNELLDILKPVIREVAVLVQTGTVGIKNEQTKQKIQLILLSLESTLNSIQIILASGG